MWPRLGGEGTSTNTRLRVWVHTPTCNVHDVVVRSAFVLQHDVQYCTGQRVHNCYCLGRKGDVCTGRLVKMHESTCVAQGFEPEATAAASEATAATSEVPVASSGVREEDYPSGLRNSRPAHLRKHAGGRQYFSRHKRGELVYHQG